MNTNQEKLNAIIPRLGGKYRLRKTIVERIPEDHRTYIELFFGAGWVYFLKEPSKVEIVNDIDGELVNLYKMVRVHAQEVERLKGFLLSSRDQFDEFKHQDPKDLTEIQRAVRYLYLISQSFASKGGSYGYSKKSKPAPHIFNRDYLLKIQERMGNTHVENRDFQLLINQYDSPESFFFCDPPYLETDQNFSMSSQCSFDLEDYKRLKGSLDQIQGRFLLTTNAHPDILTLFKDYYIEPVQVGYSVSKENSGRRSFSELIITNYETTPKSSAA